MRRAIFALTAILALTQPSVLALADTPQEPRLSTSGSFTAPVGFQIFCLQNASFCRGGGAAEVSLTEAVLQTLKAVNSGVNRSIRPTSERQDIWQLGVSRGDCEDYVLAKRAQLMNAGLPAAALRIAAVKTRQGVGHAVLVVRTGEGDLVLDNLTSQILPANKTSLSFVGITAADGRTWKRVS